MTRNSEIRPKTSTCAVLGLAVLFSLVSLQAQAQQKKEMKHTAPAHPFAQALVSKTLAAHPETDEIGIAVTSAGSCTVVASSDRSDVGEKCEEDDSAPIRTGKPSVGKEGGEFDVAVPLHDKTGAAVGAVTVRFKKAAGQSRTSMANAATAIAKEMAGQIPSQTALLGR